MITGMKSNRRFLLSKVLILALLSVNMVFAEDAELSELTDPGFVISNVSTSLIDNVYYLDAEIDYQLSDKVIEDLHNGVKIVIAFDIKIYRDRWYGSKEIADLKQRYYFKYHTLSRQYILIHNNSGEQEVFSKLEKLLDRIHNIKHVPLLDKSILPQGRPLLVKVKVYLEVESLPLPLRAVAYFSSDWRLDSDWSVWSLED